MAYEVGACRREKFARLVKTRIAKGREESQIRFLQILCFEQANKDQVCYRSASNQGRLELYSYRCLGTYLGHEEYRKGKLESDDE